MHDAYSKLEIQIEALYEMILLLAREPSRISQGMTYEVWRKTVLGEL